MAALQVGVLAWFLTWRRATPLTPVWRDRAWGFRLPYGLDQGDVRGGAWPLRLAHFSPLALGVDVAAALALVMSVSAWASLRLGRRSRES